MEIHFEILLPINLNFILQLNAPEVCGGVGRNLSNNQDQSLTLSDRQFPQCP